MNNKLRVAVVGLGRVAKSHLAAIRELTGKIELTALVSRDEQKLLREAALWNSPCTYTSFDIALEDKNVDAFLLLLPHHLHASYAMKAMAAGKHVLVEKPMAMTQEEARLMVRAAEDNKVRLMVGQSRRFYRPVMESIEKVRSKEIGNVIHIVAMLLAHMDKPAVDWWKDESQIGGFIIPLWGSHIIDYIIWAYGELPISVYAQGYSNNDNWQGEDETTISFRFSGGRMATLAMSFNAGFKATDEEGLTGKRIWSTQNSVYERYLIGTNGMLKLEDEHSLYMGDIQVSCEEPYNSNFSWQLSEFADAIAEGRDPLASGGEIYQVMKVIDACYESIRTNQVVLI